MNVQKTNDDFDLDLDSVLIEEEEITDNRPVERQGIDTRTAAEAEIYRQKLAKMEEEMQKLTSKLEAGSRTSFLDELLQKYGDNVDPTTRNFSIELLQGFNSVTQAEMKKIYDVVDSFNKELMVTKKSIEDVGKHIGHIQSNYAFDRLVEDYLQRGLKGKKVDIRHIESAKKAHFDRLDKDEAYFLKVDNVINKKNITEKQKDKLIGQIILENFHELLVKKQADGKLGKDDPTPKKKIEADKTVEKIQKKADKEPDTHEEVSEESEEPTPEQVKAQEEAKKKAREAFQARLKI